MTPTHASALAALILDSFANQPLTDELRSRLAERAEDLKLDGTNPLFRSLERDPDDPAAFYVAADGPAPQLLHVSRTGVRARPFASSDRESVRWFAEKVNRAFLPRPQHALAAIAVGNRHPEISLPAAFQAFREILAKRGLNLASTVQLSATREMTTDDAIAARDGENPTAAGHTRVSIRHLYHAGLWAAIRSGWREGYNAEADHFIVTGNNASEIARSVEAAKEAIRHAAGYTKFTTDTSRLFILEADTRHPAAWSDSTVADRFGAIFSADERAWILGEFVRRVDVESNTYDFTRAEVMRLAVKFGESLKLNEELFDFIRQAKSGAPFDFEPSIDEAETLTTPKELFFYMGWLKLRGRPAQLVPPNLGFKKRQAYPVRMERTPATGVGLSDYAHHKMWPELAPRVTAQFAGRPVDELAHRVRELAAVARHFDGTLSIHSGSGKQEEVLESIGRSTAGRVNYKISGELQLQLFDVLSEQPAASAWRALYERMVERCNEFAAHGAFGGESQLAETYRAMGRGSHLGDAARGRVDGNLFLVFWLGNLVGSRDARSPDGDRRFFKEKLDELPCDLITEVQKRNTRYIVWLAEHLMV
ncbi:MAG TPA: tagaturonate epimerase family protein [Bryobacteraceae bacterium]|nr:tagaturonate epimerase family protein [Bryobacteraceae bacterium]